MVDAVRVFDPGFRVTDANGTPQSGATIEFYDSGTSDSRAVYTDSGLATSAGAIVTCDSGGYPSVNDVKALLFTGSTAYKIICKDAANVTLWTHDAIKGAVDTSSFLSGDVVAESPVLSSSSDVTIVAGDKGKLYDLNCSGAEVVATLLSAVTAEDGYRIGFRHNGSANSVAIRTVSSQTIGALGYTGEVFTLRYIGEVVWLTSNGAGWVVSEYVPPLLSRDISIIRVTDRLTAPPVSPATGSRYLVNGTPTGAWSSFSENDILEYDGLSGYIQYTPTADCGWIAYIIDEDLNTQYQGSAWVDLNNVTQTFKTLHIQEQQATSVDGGTFTSGAWQTRPLNTVIKNSITGASLGSNRITLPIGSYHIAGSAIGYRCADHQTRLRNITDTSTDILGQCSYSATGSSGGPSNLFGTLVLTAEKTFELQHRCSSTSSVHGFGTANSFGEQEIYADVLIYQFKDE